MADPDFLEEPAPSMEDSWGGSQQQKTAQFANRLSARLREIELKLAGLDRNFFTDGDGNQQQALLAPSTLGNASRVPWDILVADGKEGTFTVRAGEVKTAENLKRSSIVPISGADKTHRAIAGQYLVLSATPDLKFKLETTGEWSQFPEIHETEAAPGLPGIHQLKKFRLPLWAFVAADQVPDSTASPVRLVSPAVAAIRLASPCHYLVEVAEREVGTAQQRRVISTIHLSPTFGGWSKA